MSIFAYVLIGIILYIIFTNKSLKEIYINIMAIFIFTYMHIEVGYFIKLGNTSVRFVWFLEIILIMFSIILLIKNKSVHKKILMNGIAFFFTIVLGLLFLFIRPLKEMIITGDVLWDDYWRRKAVMNYPQLSSNNIESLVQVGVFIIILIMKNLKKYLIYKMMFFKLVLVIQIHMCIYFQIKKFLISIIHFCIYLKTMERRILGILIVGI